MRYIPLLISSGILFGTGFLFYSMGFKANEHSAGRREGMLIVTLTWILFSLFGMLPFYIGGYIDNVTDAFFETMSGFTTTGSTILTNIEALPKGILFLAESYTVAGRYRYGRIHRGFDAYFRRWCLADV